MNTHPSETLNLSNGAKLIFTPCPGTKGVNLDESLSQLKQQDVSMLLTLMFDEELIQNNAVEIPQLCNIHKVKWLQLPIVDDEAPQAVFEQQWTKHKALILNEIINKGAVAVHCKGGTGRTGTVITLLLLELGWPVAKIKQEIQKIKPNALRIQKQIDYLNSQLKSTQVQF